MRGLVSYGRRASPGHNRTSESQADTTQMATPIVARPATDTHTAFDLPPPWPSLVALPAPQGSCSESPRCHWQGSYAWASWRSRLCDFLYGPDPE